MFAQRLSRGAGVTKSVLTSAQHPRLAAAHVRRGMADSGISRGGAGRQWQDRERSVENQYFNEEEAKKLHELSQKLSGELKKPAEDIEEDSKDLEKILEKNGVKGSRELREALLKFKHG